MRERCIQASGLLSTGASRAPKVQPREMWELGKVQVGRGRLRYGRPQPLHPRRLLPDSRQRLLSLARPALCWQLRESIQVGKLWISACSQLIGGWKLYLPIPWGTGTLARAGLPEKPGRLFVGFPDPPPVEPRV